MVAVEEAPCESCDSKLEFKEVHETRQLRSVGQDSALYTDA